MVESIIFLISNYWVLLRKLLLFLDLFLLRLRLRELLFLDLFLLPILPLLPELFLLLWLLLEISIIFFEAFCFFSILPLLISFLLGLLLWLRLLFLAKFIIALYLVLPLLDLIIYLDRFLIISSLSLWIRVALLSPLKNIGAFRLSSVSSLILFFFSGIIIFLVSSTIWGIFREDFCFCWGVFCLDLLLYELLLLLLWSSAQSNSSSSID